MTVYGREQTVYDRIRPYTTVFLPFTYRFSPETRPVFYDRIFTVILPYACRKYIVYDKNTAEIRSYNTGLDYEPYLTLYGRIRTVLFDQGSIILLFFIKSPTFKKIQNL